MLKTVALLAVLHGAPAADSIPGTWQIKGDIMGNPIDQVCSIQQSGTALSGSCAAEGGQSYDLTGEAKEGKLTFQHAGDYQGQALTIIYSGTLISPREIKGTVTVQPFNVSGEFSAAPATAKP